MPPFAFVYIKAVSNKVEVCGIDPEPLEVILCLCLFLHLHLYFIAIVSPTLPPSEPVQHVEQDSTLALDIIP